MPYIELIVKNIDQKDLKECNSENLLKHWENFHNEKNYNCVVVGCDHKADVGSVIEIIEPMKCDQHYIVPLCKDHGLVKDQIMVKSFIAPIKLNNKCEK